MLAKLDTTFIPPILQAIFYDYIGISISPAKNLETELPNNIKIYKKKKTVYAITCLINEYLLIWKSLEFIKVF